MAQPEPSPCGLSVARRGPPKPSAVGHAADFIVFRSAGGLVIFNEVRVEPVADWHVLVAGFALFFMPDAVRGRSSLVWRLLEAVIAARTADSREDGGDER